jgi:hypothetical protein
MEKLRVMLAGHARRVVNLMALAFAFVQMASADPPMTVYVTTNGNGVGYPTWAEATNSIQTAIDIISNSSASTVWVSNGVYNTGGVTNYPAGYILTNRVAIWKAITVRSANNDPTNTIIVGAKDPATNGPAAVRCVYMANGSALIGFTLTNGATTLSGAGLGDRYGGGVYCVVGVLTTVISNCVIANNSAVYGGGTYGGNLYNCSIIGNSATNGGGGTCPGNMYNCRLVNNSAGKHGGAAFQPDRVLNCTIVSNSAILSQGGGIYQATSWISNCTVVGNSSGNNGGGVNNSTLYNCLIASNSGVYGGGVSECTLYNCTVAGNSGTRCGGAYAGNFINCIVYLNNPGGTNNWYDTTSKFTNSCTYPTQSTWQTSDRNITNNPLFVNTNTANYRLIQSSPCINAGTNQSWMNGAVDLDGYSRIDRFSGIVDMGCFEYLPSGMMVTVP